MGVIGGEADVPRPLQLGLQMTRTDVAGSGVGWGHTEFACCDNLSGSRIALEKHETSRIHSSLWRSCCWVSALRPAASGTGPKGQDWIRAPGHDQPGPRDF